MYIQITNRCNMTCEHCCYACTKDGQDMSLDTFRKALDICREYGSIPFLGGGEPTLHRQFERMLFEAVMCAAEIDNGLKVGVITNGSIKRRALMIAHLASMGVITGSVSQDQYHDPIDHEVVEAFENLHEWGAVWDTSSKGSREPMPHGRAKELIGFDEEDDERDDGDCPCSNWMVRPDGKVYQCGCEDSPQIGDVENGVSSPLSSECFRSNWFIRECEESDHEHLIYA